jgi:glycine/D-amino acid oxidase-like deaminating enzyme
MRRRDFLEAAGIVAAAGFTGACAERRPVAAAAPPPAPPPAPTRAPVNLALPRISWERVIRTTVGLRPHRDSGFVLKPEKFDEKTVIHDYGFGGAGMSLSWGCGAIAADMALQHNERRAAVLGCGAPGLTAARQLQRRGFEVTIYAMSVPPDTTSNMSYAGFTPTTALISPERRTPAWDAQFLQAAEISYRQLQLLAGPRGYGVYWIDAYNAIDDPARGGRGPAGPGAEGELIPDRLRPERDREVLGPGEHPFPTKYAVRTSSLAIEPNIYLDALVRDFLLFGGRVVIRKFDTPRDLMSLPESIVVNCTGLGSKSLFNDDELVPIKGQLTLCIPQPEVNYRASGRLPDSGAPPAPGASMNPRSDGIVIGNMMERGNWSLEPNEDVRRQNVDAAIRFFGAMRAPSSVRITSLVPPRVVPRLESFLGTDADE